MAKSKNTILASLLTAAGDIAVSGSGSLTGDLTVQGRLTAQEYHSEIVSSSILYTSGSTKFGDSADDTHQFTGSVNISGSILVNGVAAIGPQGATGSQGATGTQGPTGFQGATGIQGSIGPQGNTGPTGLQGTTGAQGDRGFQGFTGPQGTTGAQGNQGPTGTQGNQGPAGPGVSGTQGYISKFTSTSTIGNSLVRDDGSGVSIGIAPQTDKLFIYNASGTNTGLTIQQDGTGDIVRFNGNSGANRFNITQAGAATFSSTIQSTGNITSNNGGFVSIDSTYNIALYQNISGGVGGLYSTSNNDFGIWTNGTRKLTVASGGNVGIGTTAPNNKLTVLGSETGTQITTPPIAKFINTGNSFSKLILGSDNANFDAVVSMDNNATLANCKLRFYIGNGTNSTAGHSNDQFVLQGNGNVGIGTTSPSALLHLSSTSPYIYLDDTSTSGTLKRFQMIFGDVGSTQTLNFGFNNTSGTSLLDVLSINEAGRVGIGTTNPLSQLEVEVASSTNTGGIFLDMTGGGGGAIVLGLGSSVGPYIVGNTFPDGTVRGGYGGSRMGFTSDGFSFDYSSTTSGTRSWSTHMKITSTGVIDFNGNSSITSASDKFALGVNSTSYAWMQSYGGRPLVINGVGNNLYIGSTTDTTSGGFSNTRVGIKQASDGGSGGGLHIEQNSNTNVAFFGFTGGAFRIGTSYRSSGAYTPIEFTTNAAIRLYIDTTPGSVLVNYTSVWNNEKFGVQIANNNNWTNVPAIMRLTNYGSGYIPKITFTDSSIIDGWFGMVPVSGGSYFAMGFSGYTEQGFKVYQNGNTITAGTATINGNIFLNSGGGYGWIYAADTNHSIIMRGDRNGTASDYTNYYQYGGNIADGKGHKFWTGGVLASQSLRFHIGNDYTYNVGNMTIGGTLTESSSIRYKENIETVENGLDKVLQMRGVTYTKKDTGVEELGLIAEEVNEILPDVVLKNSEGEPDSVSYGRITAVLIEAIKDLQQQINVLNSK